MDFRRLTLMINTTNAYSVLKYPLLVLSIFITFSALTILLAYQSHAWFTYESFTIVEQTIPPNRTVNKIQLLEYGSFGLWEICLGHDQDRKSNTCTTWTRRTRPEYFQVILVLATVALVFANLTIFPSWAATILVIYNISNRYTGYIVALLWVLLVSSLIISILLIFVMSMMGITKYYSPGEFTDDFKYLTFHTDWGIVFLFIGKYSRDFPKLSAYLLSFSATILAIAGLILIIVSLIWRKFITMRLIEEEKQLYHQLTTEEYSSSWHQLLRFPRDSAVSDDDFEEPPPYR